MPDTIFVSGIVSVLMLLSFSVVLNIVFPVRLVIDISICCGLSGSEILMEPDAGIGHTLTEDNSPE